MLAPHAKVEMKEGNHTYTLRLTNNSHPVAWLEAEVEEDEIYSTEDMSGMDVCDHYIMKSSVSTT